MLNLLRCVAAVAFTVALCTSLPGFAQTGHGHDHDHGHSHANDSSTPPAATLTEGERALLSAWSTAAARADGHTYLDAWVGHWTTRTRIWTEGPNTEPHESTGEATLEWILDGRFMREESHGSILGRDQHGLGLIGYDTQKRKFVSMWIDTMSTAMTTTHGALGTDGKTVTFYGTVDDPFTGERDTPARYVFTNLDDGRRVFQAYDLRVDPGYLVMEIEYVRVP